MHEGKVTEDCDPTFTTFLFSLVHTLPLSFSFCQQITYGGLTGDDIRAANQSHEGTYKAQHSKMTSLKNKRRDLLKSLKKPHSEILESLLLLLFPSPMFYLQLFSTKYKKRQEEKKKERKNRLILMRWLTTPDTEGLFSLWWEDH